MANVLLFHNRKACLGVAYGCADTVQISKINTWVFRLKLQLNEVKLILGVAANTRLYGNTE
jgi:hypothetical protein